MNWLDIAALASVTTVFFSTKTFYGRIFSSALLTHYVAAMLIEFGGGMVQPLTRVFGFIVIFVGFGLSIVMFFAQSNRDKEGTEK